MDKKNRAYMIEFSNKGDKRGQLVIIENGKEIPFNMQRIFYIYGSDKDVVRGCHANKDSEFVLINVSGSSKLKVEYLDGDSEIFSLIRPYTGVYLPKMVWKEMFDFSFDSVLLCIASTKYDENEYIREKHKWKEYEFLY